ncbi:MAG TPA: long-chain fatty acid--CoA ligase [Euzebyales bacterium]|nr:long-chain fatty acid--CoA ligase [Euzebyales bacterium]
MTDVKRPWLAVYGDEITPRVIEASLNDFFDDAVRRFADHVALTAGTRRVTYGELAELVGRFAAALGGAGVAKGDRVGLMSPNTVEYVVAFFGALRVGAAVTQVNPLYMSRELTHILASSDVGVLVVDAAVYDKVGPVRDATAVTRVVCAGEPDSGLADGDMTFEQFMTSGDGPAPQVEIDHARDLAVLQYTGGTTGLSKGAMLTHRNLLSAVQPTYDLLMGDPGGLPNNAKAVAVAPFFHIFGMTMVLLASLLYGWNMVLVRRFDTRAMMELIRDEQPAVMAGVATIFTALQSQPDLEAYGFDRVRLYLSGGASVPVSLLKAYEQRTGRTILEGYGMSEGAPVTFNTYLRGSVGGSIGVPIPGTDVQIVDVETGEPVARGEPGELIFRGPQVMQGYLGMPDETAAALRDGWLHSGDIAEMREDGYLFIVDRMKDLINASGYKIYPREVEEVIYELEDVVEVAVFGVPDQYRGETVRAALVTRPDSALTAEDVADHCARHLAAYKVPKLVEFRAALPKSGAGKLLKRELVAEAAQQSSS